MKTDKLNAILTDLAEKAAPASQVDLWPQLSARLQTSTWQSQSGDPMKTLFQNIPPRRLALAALALIFAFSLLAFTPQGRALAQGILQLFTRAEQDSYPLQAWQMTPPAASSPESPFQLSFQEAETQAGFDTFAPLEPPAGMIFLGASYDSQHQIVAQSFGREPASFELTIWQQPIEAQQSCGDISNYCDNITGGDLVGASAEVQTVQIGAVSGEYVEGVWNLTDTGPVWEPTPLMKTLRWQTAEMVFVLTYMGMDLDRDALVVLAASLR